VHLLRRLRDFDGAALSQLRRRAGAAPPAGVDVTDREKPT
jgi:hypothetical protein